MDPSTQAEEAQLRISLMKMLDKDYAGAARSVNGAAADPALTAPAPSVNGAANPARSSVVKKTAFAPLLTRQSSGPNLQAPLTQHQQPALTGKELLALLPEHIWAEILIRAVGWSHPRRDAILKSPSSRSLSSASSASGLLNGTPNRKPVHIRASDLKHLRPIALVSRRFNQLVQAMLKKCVAKLSVDLCNDPLSLVVMATNACPAAAISCSVNPGGRHMCTENCLTNFVEIAARLREMSVNAAVAIDDRFNHTRWLRVLRLMAKNGILFPALRVLRLRGVHTSAMFEALADVLPDNALRSLSLVGVDHSTRTLKNQAALAERKDNMARELAQIARFKDSLTFLQVSESIFQANQKPFEELHRVRALDLTWIMDADTAFGIPVTQKGILNLIHGFEELRFLNVAAGSTHSSPGRHAHKLHLLELPILHEVTIGVYKMGADDPPSKFLQSLDDATSVHKDPVTIRKVNIVFRDHASRSPQQFMSTYTIFVRQSSRTRPGSSPGLKPDGAWGRTWADIQGLASRTGIAFHAINLSGEALYGWRPGK